MSKHNTIHPPLINREDLLQLVLNHTPSFVFWKDTNSIYQGCNLNFAKSAGLELPDEIIGKSDYDLPWSKEESDYFRKIDKEVMESGVAKMNFEEPQTINNGTTRWVKTNKIPLKNKDGQVVGILGTYEDITQRKHTETELLSKNEILNNLNTELEATNKSLKQFSYAAYHDVMEPIKMIGRFSGLLNKRYAHTLDKKGKEYVDYISEGVGRISTMITQIQTYSQLRQLEVPFTTADFNEIVNEILTEMKPTIEEKNTVININLPKAPIRCQPRRIKVLLQHLIANGIKFNTSPRPMIHIDFEEQNEEWLFSVADNGISISNEYQDVVFQPFKRLNTRDKFSGNGMGLSICKRIIGLHGGNIYYTNQKNEGSTFHFSIAKKL